MKAGNITNQILNKKFPDKWEALGRILGFEVVLPSTDHKNAPIMLLKGDNELFIHRDNTIEISFSLSDENIRDIIIHAAKTK